MTSTPGVGNGTPGVGWPSDQNKPKDPKKPEGNAPNGGWGPPVSLT